MLVHFNPFTPTMLLHWYCWCAYQQVKEYWQSNTAFVSIYMDDGSYFEVTP